MGKSSTARMNGLLSKGQSVGQLTLSYFGRMQTFLSCRFGTADLGIAYEKILATGEYIPEARSD